MFSGRIRFTGVEQDLIAKSGQTGLNRSWAEQAVKLEGEDDAGSQRKTEDYAGYGRMREQGSRYHKNTEYRTGTHKMVAVFCVFFRLLCFCGIALKS